MDATAGPITILADALSAANENIHPMAAMHKSYRSDDGASGDNRSALGSQPREDPLITARSPAVISSPLGVSPM
jgi:hypothetical protein